MEQTSRRPLKIGVFLPTGEGLMGGATPRWSDIVGMARLAEEVGFDSVWVNDHLLMRFEGRFTEPRGTWECWTLMAALAAATARVELGTLVSTTTFRNPALLAKIIDTIDEISGGRVIAGLGAGDSELEHAAFGLPYDHRASRFEEAIQIISGLLREGASTFHGRYYQTEQCELRPRGPRPGGPPILIGARPTSPRMLSLAVRYGDQWNAWLVFGNNHPQEVPPLRAAVDDACRAIGRDPASLERTITVQVDFSDRGGRPRRPELLWGSPEELATAFRAFAAEGVSHLQIVPRPSTAAAIEALAPALAALDRG
ncbi:MAG TPA: LLM class flavin-dependent oxidoreductase [Thermomicrobiaceae bacterium]|nr:LLM class flavin-dependent oxidoreductase [Thermomicrobiaceae bacterium]